MILQGSIKIDQMSIFDFESSLYPNESSSVGFLLPEQTLGEVIINDLATAANYGLTLQQIGCVLARCETSRSGFARERMVRKFLQGEYEIDGTFRILTRTGTKGYQECPFAELDEEECTYGRYTMIIEKIATKERFSFESLVAHLIKDHNFCEGPGTPYRLDLEGAIRFFGLTSEIDYSLRTIDRWTWECSFAKMGGCKVAEFLSLESLAVATFTDGPFLAWLLPCVLSPLLQLDPQGSPLESLYQYYLKTDPDAQSKIDIICMRRDSYQPGCSLMGYSLVLLASNDFNYPTDGLSATRVDRSVSIAIPELHFDYRNSSFRMPSMIQYQAKKTVYYL